MLCMAKNRSLAYCKVVEVIAETTAPLTSMEELLAKIPSQRVEPKKSFADGPDPPSSKSIIPDEPTAPITKEPAQTKAKAVQTLSPYTVYEDLKPPSSPSPTQSTTGAPKLVISESSSSLEPSGTTIDKEATEADVKKLSPPSPYITYDDLKPPTSPTPTPPSGQKNLTIVDGLSISGTSDTQTSTSGVMINVTETAAQEVPSKSPLSPYVAYEDLKPPSSPSPTPSGPNAITSSNSVPVEAVSPLNGGNDVVKITITSVVEENPSQNSTYHLSPYHMYEDMKPPTSPIPSSPRKS